MASLLVPLIEIPIFEYKSLEIIENIYDPFIMAEIVLEDFSQNSINYFLLISALYGFLTLIFLSRITLSFFKLLGIKKRSTFREPNIYVSNEIESPYSFLNCIYLPCGLDSQFDLGPILLHENAHIKRKHSWHKIILTVIVNVFWLLPLLRIIRRELNLIQEYEADATVLNEYSKDYYMEALMRSLSPISHSTLLTHTFFSSSIKNRIIMLHQKTKNNTSKKIASLFMLTFVLSVLIIDQCLAQSNAEFFKEFKQEMSKDDADVKFIAISYKGNGSLFAYRDGHKPFDQHVEKPERMPVFPGGEEALKKYFKDNLKYPIGTRGKKNEVRVVVQFIINEKGKVIAPHIVNNLPKQKKLYEEAERVIRNMPDWKPALDKGKSVATTLELPIHFKL